jgi:hypothetical protein
MKDRHIALPQIEGSKKLPVVLSQNEIKIFINTPKLLKLKITIMKTSNVFKGLFVLTIFAFSISVQVENEKGNGFFDDHRGGNGFAMLDHGGRNGIIDSTGGGNGIIGREGGNGYFSGGMGNG